MVTNVAAAIFWSAFVAALVAGLVSTTRDRRHHRGEWAAIDERHAADDALAPRRVR